MARIALVVIGLWALASAVWLGRQLFLIVFLAVLFASFLSALMRPLQRLRTPRPVAAVAAFLIWVGLLAGCVALLLPMLRRQMSILGEQLPHSVDVLQGWLSHLAVELGIDPGSSAQPLSMRYREELARLAQQLVRGALPFLGSVMGAVATLLVVIFGGLYLAIEAEILSAGLVALVPPPGRPRARQALQAAGHNLRRWLLATLISMALIGVLSGVGLVVLGVPSALALGTLAGLLEIVPVFGPVVAAIPAATMALSISPLRALSVLLLYLAVQQVESNLIAPAVMKGVVKLPAALSVFFQLLMAMLFGFIGVLIAVPLLVVVIVLVKMLYVDALGPEPPAPGPAAAP